MPLFLSLYLGHILGDFLLQPGRLVLAKRKRLDAVLLHTAIVTACTAAVVAGELARVWPAVLLVGVAHFGVEQLTIRARRSPQSSNATVFLLDQGLHIMAMVVVSMGGLEVAPAIGFWSVPLRTLAVVCGLGTVTLAGSILIFELQVAGKPAADGTDRILALDAARVYGFLERGTALLAALYAPWPLLGALAFVPRLAFGMSSRRAVWRDEALAAFVGLALCAIARLLILRVGS